MGFNNSKQNQARFDAQWEGYPPRTSDVETVNATRVRGVRDNAPEIFSAVVFLFFLAASLGVGYWLIHAINIWVVLAAFVVAVVAVLTIHIASEWEKVVILRLGSFNRLVGHGVFLTIPFVETIAFRADTRVMLTGFFASEILTSDLVPVNVDAVVFWTVWDAKKACLEVGNYYDAVSMTAQAALRDAIGRKEITDIIVHRDKLDKELKVKIEEKTSAWGISIISIEIRDVVIPKELQADMAIAAKAEREKQARIMLAEIETDVAEMLLNATEIYRKDELAFELRSMHLLSEGVKDSRGTVVIPSAYSEGFRRGQQEK